MALTVLKVIDAWKWFAEAEQMFQASLALVRRGHRVEIACQPESPAAARAREAGLPVHALPGLRGPRLPTTPLANVGRLRGVVRAVGPDLVHAYRSPPHVLSALALQRLGPGRPVLVRTRAGAQPITRNPLNRLLYDRWTALTLVSSDRIRDDMTAGGFDGGRIRPVPSAVDLRRLRDPDPVAFRRAVGLPLDAPVMGIVGRLAPVKGHVHFLEALSRVQARHPGVWGCVVGPDAELDQAWVAREAARVGVADRLRVVGPREDVGSALAAFNVVTIASVGSEVISRVLLEALWLARPVVATRVGILPEATREGRLARLVPPGEPGALAAAWVELLADPAAAARMGEAGRETVSRHHRPEDLAEALESAYLEALGRR